MSASPTASGSHAVATHGPTEHPSDMLYVKVALLLAVLTAIEVATYFFDFKAAFVPVLVGLMTVKFFVVLFFFMHLKFDSKLFRRVFYSGLLFAIGVYVVALTTFHFWTAGA
jgi:cytochrome c oxidase subunit IV